MLQTTMGDQHRLHKTYAPQKKVTTIMMMNKTEEKPTLDPSRKIHDHKHNIEIAAFIFQELQGMISMNETGCFLIASSQGNTAIMVMCNHDSNITNATPIKTTKWNALINGYNKLYNDLRKAEITPVILQLDNENSKEMIEEIKEDDLEYQIVPPGSHRTLSVERAIQMFKNHFISILWGTDDNFLAN